MKVYFKAILIFAIVFTLGVILRQCCQQLIPLEFIEIYFKVFLLLSFLPVMLLCVKDKSLLFRKFHWRLHYGILILILFLLFIGNNYLMARYSDNQHYSETIKSAFGLNLLAYTISSIAEEIIYRGFLQTYINENSPSNRSLLSKGNIISTVLFFLSHLAFFTVMDTAFALTSLVNVLCFSFTAGYLLDKTKNIIVPIAIHVAINLTHVLIQLKYSS